MDAERSLERAFKHAQAGDWTQAIALYDEVAHKSPEHSTYATNCANELRDRQRMADQANAFRRTVERLRVARQGTDLLVANGAELPEHCFRCGAAGPDVLPQYMPVMARGIPLVQFDKEIGTYYVNVCPKCRKRKWRIRLVGIILLAAPFLFAVVPFPLPILGAVGMFSFLIGALICARGWRYTNGWYEGGYIRVPKFASTCVDGLPDVDKELTA